MKPVLIAHDAASQQKAASTSQRGRGVTGRSAGACAVDPDVDARGVAVVDAPVLGIEE